MAAFMACGYAKVAGRVGAIAHLFPAIGKKV
jgi:thiamine pyrophosphate-dependent acetolactate synthase large subunit-like protein